MDLNTTQWLTLITRIFISICLLVFGGYFLIAGKLSFRKYNLKGPWVRVIGAVTLLGSAIYFLGEQRGFFREYGALIQLGILLIAIILFWILAEKPAQEQHLPIETSTTSPRPMNRPTACTYAFVRMAPAP